MHDLPDGWTLARLKDLSPEGGRYGSGEAAIEYNPALPRYVRITDIEADGRLSSTSCASIKEAEARPYMLSPGDLLFARSGATVGKTYLYREADGPCAHAGYVIRFSIDRSMVFPDYLSHWAKGNSYWRWVKSTFRQGAQPNINAAEYGGLEIPIPPMSEQQRIVEILDEVDAQVAHQRLLIDKLRVLGLGLIEAAISRISPRYPIPLGEIASIFSGVTLGGESGSIEVPYLRVANVQDGFIDTSEMKVVRVGNSDLRRFSLKVGDVLLTEGGDLDKLGRGAVWDGRIDPCICQNHVFCVRCNSDRIIPEYLSAYVASTEGKRYFLSIAKQTTNLATINSSQLKGMPIPLPSIDVQKDFVSLVRVQGERIAFEESVLGKLISIKRGVAEDLLAGRVRAAGAVIGRI